MGELMREPHHLRRTDLGKMDVRTWLTIGCLVFTIGTNWQKVSGQQGDIDKLRTFNEQTLPKEYVTREIYNIGQQHMIEALNAQKDTIDRLNVTLEKLYAIERDTGEPARVQGLARRGAHKNGDRP